jgi:hypothetical protein
MLDYYFYYKYIGRFILYLKNSSEFFHFINILEFNKLVLFFDIYNINDLNSINILSHIFFFKYYFGVLPFFTNYIYKFKLNINYYNFFIQYNFFEKNIYYPLYFFFNDVYYMINKFNLNINKKSNFWNFCINDMNFFIEKKNTLGFFNLKYKLNFSFFLIKIEKLSINNLFYLFKYKA